MMNTTIEERYNALKSLFYGQYYFCKKCGEINHKGYICSNCRNDESNTSYTCSNYDYNESENDEE